MKQIVIRKGRKLSRKEHMLKVLINKFKENPKEIYGISGICRVLEYYMIKREEVLELLEFLVQGEFVEKERYDRGIRPFYTYVLRQEVTMC